MTNEKKRLVRMVHDIFTTQEDEIQCDAASTQMVLATEAKLSEEESQKRFPQLWRHFRVCSDCLHEYRMLQDMIHLEETGQLDYPEVVPPVPKRNQPADWSPPNVIDVISRIFPGFSPSLVPALTRGDAIDIEPVEMDMDDQVRLALSVDIHEAEPDLRDLFGTIVKEDESLAGSPVQLQLEKEGPVIQETALDESGDFYFSAMKTGQYTLRFQVGEQVYTVSNIDLL